MEVTTHNPLRYIVEHTKAGEWMETGAFMPILKEAFKPTGYVIDDIRDQAMVMSELFFGGFVEHSDRDLSFVRVKERWYDSI